MVCSICKVDNFQTPPRHQFRNSERLSASTGPSKESRIIFKQSNPSGSFDAPLAWVLRKPWIRTGGDALITPMRNSSRFRNFPAGTWPACLQRVEIGVSGLATFSSSHQQRLPLGSLRRPKVSLPRLQFCQILFGRIDCFGGGGAGRPYIRVSELRLRQWQRRPPSRADLTMDLYLSYCHTNARLGVRMKIF